MTKKTWLRVATLLLSLALMVGMATACGGKTPAESDEESQATATTTTPLKEEFIGGEDEESEIVDESTDEATSDVSAEEVSGDSTTAPAGDGSTSATKKTTTTTKKSDGGSSATTTKDLKGRVITIALFGESSSKAFTDSAEGIYADSIREMAKKYNCKFRIVTVPIQKLIDTVDQDAMDGTATWDLTMVEGYHVVPKQCLSGSYLCLSDYYNFNDGVWNGSVMEGVGEYEGKRYALPIGFGGDMGVFYNKNLVKAANLPDPWTYVEKNTWDWNTFKTFAKALTKDTDNDGQPNQFGFACENPYLQFVLTNEAQVIDMSSGHGKFAMDSANAKEALNFVQSLYDEQIIPTPDQYAELGMQDAFTSMSTGKTAMFTYGAAYGPWLAEEAGMDFDEIGWVYLPQGPKSDRYVSASFTQQSMLMVQKHAKDPADVVLVMQDVMAFWSKNHKSAMTPDQVREKNATSDYIVDFLQGNHLKMYKELAKNVECINAYSYSAANELINSMIYDIRTKAHTVQSGLDAYKSAIQAAITSLEEKE